MTTSFLLLLASSLPAAGPPLESSAFEQALVQPDGHVFRAQSPGPFAGSMPLAAPPPEINSYYPPTFGNGPIGPQLGPIGPSYSPGMPAYPAPIQDPWLGGGVPPYAMPVPCGPARMFTYGMYGRARPRRLGWGGNYDISYLPAADARDPARGNLEIFGLDMEQEFVHPIAFNWAFAVAPQFTYRSFQGPSTAPPAPPTTDLPGGAYRFGLGLKLQSPDYCGWSYEFGFNPAIGSDFRSSLTSDAYMWDGHAVAFWRVSPQWMWAFGAAYWDRLEDLVIPYAGFVWNPDPIWEFRILLPRPEVNVFLGMPWGVPTWAYVAGEYHVEAYEMAPKELDEQVQVQFRDWRLGGGFRWETGFVTSFVEASWVFGRKVQFSDPGTNFDVSSGFLGRVGLSY